MDAGVGGDSLVYWLGAGKMDAALSGAEEYLQIIMGALEYAIFPHARSPMFAVSFGSVNRDTAWEWITDPIEQNVMGENRIQAPNLPKIADIFARTMELMGRCRFPLYLSKSPAEDWFLIWRMLNGQRMERNGWAFAGAEEEQNALHPSMAPFRRIAERNQAEARLRYPRARRLASQEDDGEVWGEDSFLEEPSADESLPPENSDPLFTPPPELSLPLSSRDPRLTVFILEKLGRDAGIGIYQGTETRGRLRA